MKPKHMILLGVMTLSGILIGFSGSLLVSCKQLKTDPQLSSSITKIDSVIARDLFRNYYDTATVFKTAFKGFTIDTDDARNLNDFFAKTGLKKARIYMAAIKDTKVRLIIGIDSKGRESATQIYKMQSSSCDPCPPICDTQSSMSFDR
jgi:hypothetical protein